MDLLRHLEGKMELLGDEIAKVNSALDSSEFLKRGDSGKRRRQNENAGFLYLSHF